MTTKLQRDSIERAIDLLMRLTEPKQTPRVPKLIREEAKAILEHLPKKCEDSSCCIETQTPKSTKTCIFNRMFSFFKN